MSFTEYESNIFVEVDHFKDLGGSFLAVDGRALAAFEVERSTLLQDLVHTCGTAEVPVNKKAFALYQRFQNAPLYEMVEISGVIQAASFLEDRETHRRACHAATNLLNAAFRQHCSDAVPPAERLMKLPSPTSLLSADRSAMDELFEPMLDLAVDDMEAILTIVHLSTTMTAPKRVRDAAVSCRISHSALDLSNCLTSASARQVPVPSKAFSHVTCALSTAIVAAYADSLAAHAYTSLSLARNSLTSSDVQTVGPLLTPPRGPLLALDLTGNPALCPAAVAELLLRCPGLTRVEFGCAGGGRLEAVEDLAASVDALTHLRHFAVTAADVTHANILLEAISDHPISHLSVTSPFVDLTTPDEPQILEIPEFLPALSGLTSLYISDRMPAPPRCDSADPAPEQHAARAGAPPHGHSAAAAVAGDAELQELSGFTWALLAVLPSVPALEVLSVHATRSAALRTPTVAACYCVLLSLFRLRELILPGCDRDRMAPVLAHMPSLRVLDISDAAHDSTAVQAAALHRRRMTLRHALAATSATSDCGHADPALPLTKLVNLTALTCVRVHCSCNHPPRRPPSPSPRHYDCACSPPSKCSPPFGLLSAVLSSSSNGSSVNTISATAAAAVGACTSLETCCGALTGLRALSLCESSCGALLETAPPAPSRCTPPPTSIGFSYPDSDFETSSDTDTTPATSGRGSFEPDEDAGVPAIAEPFLRPQYQLTRLHLCHVRRMRSLLCGIANFAPELRELSLGSTYGATELAEHFDAVPSRAFRGALRQLCSLTSIALDSVTAAQAPAMLRCVAGAPALRRLELTVCAQEGEEWENSLFVEELHTAAEDAFGRLACLEELSVAHRGFAGADGFVIDLLWPIAVGRLTLLQELHVRLRGPPPLEWCRGLWQHMKGLPLQRGVHIVPCGM